MQGIILSQPCAEATPQPAMAFLFNILVFGVRFWVDTHRGKPISGISIYCYLLTYGTRTRLPLYRPFIVILILILTVLAY